MWKHKMGYKLAVFFFVSSVKTLVCKIIGSFNLYGKKL